MNQTYKEIMEDQLYMAAYKAAEKAFNKKYDKLFNASYDWFVIYESSFGTPNEDGTPEYWRLRKLLKLPS